MKLKHMIQRIRKGYCNLDIYSIDYWLQTVLPNAIDEMNEQLYSHPQQEFEEVDSFPSDFIEKEFPKLKQDAIDLLDLKEKEDIDALNLKDPYMRWKLVLRRLSYCLRESDDQNSEYSNEYFEPYFNRSDEIAKIIKGKESLLGYLDNEVREALKEDQEYQRLKILYETRQQELDEFHVRMKDEAMDLLKKYFYNLWN